LREKRTKSTRRRVDHWFGYEEGHCLGTVERRDAVKERNNINAMIMLQ
jgi:hypothetical protein